MKTEIPKYFDPVQNKIYQADQCIPLRKAWKEKELELKSAC